MSGGIDGLEYGRGLDGVKVGIVDLVLGERSSVCLESEDEKLLNRT